MVLSHGGVCWSAVCDSYIALTFLFVSIMCGSSSRRRVLVCSVGFIYCIIFPVCVNNVWLFLTAAVCDSYIALTFLLVSIICGISLRCRGMVCSVGFIYCINFPVCVNNKWLFLTVPCVGMQCEIHILH